jgi:hypothetical protein
LAALFVLAGCASGVKRDAEYGGTPGQAATPLPVSAVTIAEHTVNELGGRPKE